MYAMQGYGSYQGLGDAYAAQAAASAAYTFLQAGYTGAEPASVFAGLTAADKAAACQLMATQAASDTDTTMKGKVSTFCGSQGVSQGFLGLSTTTWIVLAVGGAGLFYLFSKKKK